MAAVAVRRNDESARHMIGDRGAKVAAHEVQAQIQSRGAAGGGENVPFIHIQHIGIDSNLRITAMQGLGVAPMSRRPPAIEQAGGRKHESTRANGQQARPPLMRPAQNIEQRLRHRCVDAFPARDHDGAGGEQALQPVLCLHLHAVLRTDAAPLRGTGLEAIPIWAQFRSRQTEHLSRAGKLEGAQAIVDHGGDERVGGPASGSAPWHDLI